MTQERVATASEVIAFLSQLPADMPVYFDCPKCGQANGFQRIAVAAMVTTKGQP